MLLRYLPAPFVLLALLPTLLVEIPAMADYPNHLARMYLLANPAANPYYVVSSEFHPNLAMDLIVPQLARFTSIESAGRSFVLFSQLLVVSGAIALEFAVKGRHALAGWTAPLCVYSMPLSFGFVNFTFGAGIALFGIASWIACRKRNWATRAAVHTIFVGGLFTAHLFALGIYGLTLGLYELDRVFRGERKIPEAAGTLLLMVAPVLAFLPIVWATGGALGGSETEWAFELKPLWAVLFFNAYSVPLSAATLAIFVVTVGYLLVTRSISGMPAAGLLTAGFLIGYVAIPFKIFDSRMADFRVLIGVILILPPFVHIRRKKLPVTRSILALLIVLNVGYAGYIWLSYRSDYAAMKASFALLPSGAFVLVGSSQTDGTPPTLFTDVPMNRAPVLAVHYAGAFVSSLFTITGQTQVEVSPNLKHLDVDAKKETYEPPSLTTLRALAAGREVPGAPRYLLNWTNDFQYVYLMGPPAENALPGVLDELARYDRFTLYAVRR